MQSFSLHALETGLADETIRTKIRPHLKPIFADEDFIGAMSLAISAEAEGSNKFSLTNKGKSAKVFTVESVVGPNTKKESLKDSKVLATLKAVQAELGTVKSEVKTLREVAGNQKEDTMIPSHHARSGELEQDDLVAKSVEGRGKAINALIATSVVA